MSHDGAVVDAPEHAAEPGPQPAVGSDVGSAMESAPPARGARGPHTVADMVRSLGLVLLLVVVVVLITFRPQGQAVTVVDYRGLLASARTGSAFPLADPVGLPTTWKATSAYYDPPAQSLGVTTWHVGFITGDGQYAGFEQTDGVVEGALRDVLGDPVDQGRTSQVGSASWERWADSAGDRRALVRIADGVAVVVDGSAEWSELEQLAGSLRTDR